MSKSSSRLNRKNVSVEFKDDDYETTKEILKDIKPYINENKKIYDPFYCNGLVKKEWKELGFDCYNEKEDAFDCVAPDFNYLITNPPFSLKKKCLELAFKYDKPFMILLPIDILGSLWFGEYFDKLQFIIPKKRYCFYKKNLGEKKSSSWFDTMWICYKINLPEKIIKIK